MNWSIILAACGIGLVQGPASAFMLKGLWFLISGEWQAPTVWLMVVLGLACVGSMFAMMGVEHRHQQMRQRILSSNSVPRGHYA